MDQDWWRVTGLKPSQLPELLVVEGSWWRRDRETQRLAHLDQVRELDAPDWWWGRWRGHAVVYACVYGAARTVEPVHILGQLGTPTVAQIGSCGGLQHTVLPGDLVLAHRVRIAEGASAHYGGGDWAVATPQLVDRAAQVAVARGLTVHRGTAVTIEVLLRQPRQLVETWSAAGYLGVDMESSATLSAAAWVGMRSLALLHVWDELLAGRSWTDPLPEADAARRTTAEAALFEIALQTCLK